MTIIQNVAQTPTVWDWINQYGSGIGAIAGVMAAIVAMIALLSAALDSRARSQPMMTAEFRLAPNSDTAAEFVVSNRGQTPARDVRVEFEPPLVVSSDTGYGAIALSLVQRYEKAIPVLNPGQELTNTWWGGMNNGSNQLVNRLPLPDDITVRISYRGIRRGRLTDSFPLTMDVVKLTTTSVSSTSFPGRLKTIDQSLKKVSENTAEIAKALKQSVKHE